jgi:TonB family protein
MLAISKVAPVRADCNKLKPSELPIVVTATKPAYPIYAVAERISGEVVVDVKINAAGIVTSANTAKGHRLLSKAAKEAALRWRFNSVPGHSLRPARLTFVFALQMMLIQRRRAIQNLQDLIEWK